MLDERPRSDVSDKYSWHCSNCKSRLSMSFFSKSKLPLQKWLLMLYLWAREYPVTDAAEEAEISSRVAVDIISVVAGSLHEQTITSPNNVGWTWSSRANR